MGTKIWFSDWLRALFIRKALSNRKLREATQKIDVVLATTRESDEAFRSMGACRVVRVANAGTSAANVQLYAPTRLMKEAETRPGLKLLFAGRLLGWKGEELAIRALAISDCPANELTLIGNGFNRKRCHKLAAKLGLEERIHFAGKIPQGEIWECYLNHDVFLFPSLHDSGGCAVIEAMATGMPVVCLDLGGPGEYVDASCGFKIQPDSLPKTVTALARAIDSLDQDRAMLRRLGEGAREKCLSCLTWEAREKKYLGIVSELIGKNTSAK